MRVWRAAVRSWDLILAVTAGAAAGIILATSGRDLEETSWPAGYAISAGIAIAALDGVALRWVSDRLKDSHYGELIRAIDRDEANASRPYWSVIASGVSLAIVGTMGLVFDGELSRPWTIAYFSGLFSLAVYSLAGTISLLRLTLWHQRQSAVLQSAREEAARKRRGGT